VKRAYLVGLALAFALLVSPFVAHADPGDHFSATISPSAVQPLGLGAYTIAITTQPNTPDAISGHIAIPSGFLVGSASAQITGGSCAGPYWNVAVLVTEIDFAAPDQGSALCAHGTLSVTFIVLAALPGDGSYEWNTTLSSFSINSPQPLLYIDGTPPTTSIVGTPPAVTNSNASFSFTGSDGSGSGVVAFLCSRDGEVPASSGCTSPKSYSGLTDGSHTFTVSAKDAAENVDLTPPSFTWQVDATAPPAPSIIVAPQNPSADTTAGFQFTDGDPTASLQCEVDGGSFVDCSSGSFTTAPLADGSHSFGVKATDPIGNVGPVTTYTWTIDTAHPLVTITEKPPPVTNQTSASFAFNAAGSVGHYECRLDSATFTTCASPKLYAGLRDGSHTFSVRTVSAGGTAGAATTYTWTVDTVPPQTAIASAPPAASTSASATFGFTSSESGSTFVCSINSSGFTPCSSPHTYTGLGDGPYTFRVEALDAAGNADPTAAAYSWKISKVGPPTVDLKPPANVTKVKVNVGYGRLQLRWRRPADRDFDHVGVYVSTSPKTPPRRLVYSGKPQSYTDRHFKNGQYYRYLVVSYDHRKNASGGRTKLVPPSALLRLPRNASLVRSVPVFRWAAVPHASYYNIQLYAHGQKLRSTWPGKARQLLTKRWHYRGRTYSLRRGLYVWYVWPGFGPRAKSRYGQLLGEGTFRVR
jgi:hypothetical protein